MKKINFSHFAFSLSPFNTWASSEQYSSWIYILLNSREYKTKKKDLQEAFSGYDLSL